MAETAANDVWAVGNYWVANVGHGFVVHWDGSALLCRYLRYWIETGHDKAGQPLTAAQVRALDQFDEVLNELGLRAEFQLKPGDLFGDTPQKEPRDG